MTPLYFVAGSFLLAVIGQTLAVGRIVWKAASVVTEARVTLLDVKDSVKAGELQLIQHGNILARVVEQLDGLERRVNYLEHPQR